MADVLGRFSPCTMWASIAASISAEGLEVFQKMIGLVKPGHYRFLHFVCCHGAVNPALILYRAENPEIAHKVDLYLWPATARDLGSAQ